MKFRKKCLWVFIILLIIRMILLYLELSLNFYPINNSIVYWITILIFILFVLSFNFKSMILPVMRYVIVGIVIIVYSFCHMFFSDWCEYTYIQSPQKTNTIIISESSYPCGTVVDVYQRKALIFKKELTTAYLSINHSVPFSTNEYEAKWLNEKTLEVVYPFNSNDAKAEWRHEMIRTE